MARARSVFDPWLLAVIVAICLLGLTVLVSATKGLVPGQPLYYVKRQAFFMIAGAVMMVVLATRDLSVFKRFGTLAYIAGLALLLLVTVHGNSALGAQRWINVGPFQLQPSEFMKVFLVLGLAKEISDRRGKLGTLRDLLPLLVYAGLPAALVLKQPDLGTALVLIGILIAMLYVGGANGWHLLLIFGGGFALMILWVWAHLRFGIFVPMHSYQLNRLLVFLNPNLDPLGTGYNIIQSQILLGSGGLMGHGMSGNAGILSFLPSRYTDFIFAVVGLDFGLAGAGLLLGLYTVMIVRMLGVAAETNDLYATLLGTGMTAMILLHVLMNAGMVMGVMPVVGVPLPFVSDGGSSVITDFMALGVVLALRRRVTLGFNSGVPV